MPGWDGLPVTVAAQTVQRSAFPDAYAKWEGLAAELVAAAGRRGRRSRPRARPRRRRWPRGSAGTAISFALGEVGKPYVWGATGPSTYDCSGLMLRAFQAAGIDLPRVSREQFYAGGHVPVAQAQPGDLLFYATDPNDPGDHPPRRAVHGQRADGGGALQRRAGAGSRCRGTRASWCRSRPAPAPAPTGPMSALEKLSVSGTRCRGCPLDRIEQVERDGLKVRFESRTRHPWQT